jgi:hypothetical protein
MLKKLLFSLITVLLSTHVQAVIVPDSITEKYSDRVVAPLEGVWQFADDGATLAIYADSNTLGDYTIVCIDSPDLRLAPGTVLGSASSSLGNGKDYSAKLYTDVSDSGVPTKRTSFKVRLNDGIIEMTAIKGPFKLDIWMLYRFYVTMSVHQTNGTKTLRARRIYPDSLPTADNPVIL